MTPKPQRTKLALLRVAFLALLAVGLLRAEPSSLDAERPISVQLHVHGSFSEGVGSIDSHSFEATQLGVDVLWWSDHGFRITGYERVSRFGFEGWERPLSRGEIWSLGRADQRKKGVALLSDGDEGKASFVQQPEPVEGTRSLRLTSTSAGEDYRPFGVRLTSDRWLHRVSLATRPLLELQVHPLQLGEDARGFVRVLLSEHAPREDVGLEQYELLYHLGHPPAEPWREGAVLHVAVPLEEERWNELKLQLLSDARTGFPFLEAGDDLLFEVELGVEARRGAQASLCFDALSTGSCSPIRSTSSGRGRNERRVPSARRSTSAASGRSGSNACGYDGSRRTRRACTSVAPGRTGSSSST